VQTSQPLRYVVEVDTWRPLWAGAAGLGVLAFLDPQERAEVLREHPPYAITASTPATPEAVEEFCAGVRAKGYAVSRGQRTDGAVALAAPVRDADERVVATMCLTVPDNRFQVADEGRLASVLTTAAADASGLLRAAGYRLATSALDLASRSRR
jgi:DNA-binding IclR family transcriptional regulator